MLRAAFILMLLCLAQANASENWSFADHPIPSFNNLADVDLVKIYERSPRKADGDTSLIVGAASYYAEKYPHAPEIKPDTLFEDRFIGYLMAIPTNDALWDYEWAHENTIRLRKAALAFHRATGHTVCTLNIDEPEAFPRLGQLLANLRGALNKDGSPIPYHGLFAADPTMPAAIDWVPELDLFLGLRALAGLGEDSYPKFAAGTDGMSAQTIDAVYNAAETGDVEAVLALIGPCHRRN